MKNEIYRVTGVSKNSVSQYIARHINVKLKVYWSNNKLREIEESKPELPLLF